MYYVSCEWEHCCGVKEIYNFDTDPDHYNHSGQTPQQLIDNLCNNSGNQNRLLHMHFVREKNWDDSHDEGYEWDEVREIVKAIPGVVEMGPFINGNSGNKLISYFWLNGDKCE